MGVFGTIVDPFGMKTSISFSLDSLSREEMKGKIASLHLEHSHLIGNGNSAESLLLKSLSTLRDLNQHRLRYARCEVLTFVLIGKYTGTFYGIEKVWKLEWRD